MVKTRHSDEVLPPSESEPQLMSLNLERHKRHSTRGLDDGGDMHNVSRAYTEGRNAFNIFEEKVVESRLRPRTGPSRAYNYLDEESSEEDMQTSLRSRRRHLSPNMMGTISPRRLREKQIKREMLESSREVETRRVRRRMNHLEVEEDSDETEQDNNESDEEQGKRHSNLSMSVKETSSRGKPRGRPPKRLKRQDMESANDEDVTDNEMQGIRRARSSRCSQLRQRMPDEEDRANVSDEEVAVNESPATSSRSIQDEGEENDNDEEEGENLRRSSRKRRQVFDTLNQSYLVSIPGQKRGDKKVKDDDSEMESQNDDDDGNEQKQNFTDMYSRVKRKRVQVKRNMYGVPIGDESGSSDDNTNNNNDVEDDGDEDDDEDDEEDCEQNNNNESRRVLRTRRSIRRPQAQRTVKSYSLRQHKPTVDRYRPPEIEKRKKKIDMSVFASTPTKNNSKPSYQSPARKRNSRKRSALNSSSSSTSQSDSESTDEKNFKRRKAKSMAKARNRMMPMNMTVDALSSSSVLKDRVKSGISLADIEPMTINKSVTFDSIGGLGKHIRKLKEMVVFPLLYENVFKRFKVDPPRGVLFYGPPGTGKTLVARALANECSQGDRTVAFFMRKGADCLSKWVGESERQLRLLFDQAYKMRPSIIFFDEIDGLAPVRSSRQDQIHSSIVSTLLALMDGLDSRGEIVVIGATNRIDSLDPALRRPGRFDREFLFPLPSLEARKQILKIHTSCWNPRLNDSFLSELAEKCVGYCGADLKALCTEAAMQALRRRYPQIYLTNEALQLDVSSINVSAKDFFDAIASITPTSQRSVSSPARALSNRVAPLLHLQLNLCMDKLSDIFPVSLAEGCSLDSAATLKQAKELTENGIPWEDLLSDEDEDAPSIFIPPSNSKGSKISKSGLVNNLPSTSQAISTFLNFTSYATRRPTTFRPRLMIVGCEGQGQTTHLAPAVIHQMENLPVHVLDLPTLYAVTAKTPEESCANVFHEAKRKCPSILYLPYMDQWWDVMADTLKATLLTLIHDLDPALPLLLLATSERPYQTLDPTLRSLFSTYSCEVLTMRNPNKEERQAFFADLLLHQAFKPPPQKKQAETMINLLNLPNLHNLRIKRRKKSGRGRIERHSLPHFIYPFGSQDKMEQPCVVKCMKDYAIAEPKSSKPEINNHLDKNTFNSGNRFTISKIANLSLKLCEQSPVNPCHHMVLRPRVAAKSGKLNCNQSARHLNQLQPSRVYMSKHPALPVKPNGLHRRNVQKMGLKCALSDCSGKRNKLFKSTFQTDKSKGFKTVLSKARKMKNKAIKTGFKKPNCVPMNSKTSEKAQIARPMCTLSHMRAKEIQLTSRQQRYIRRLQRLETKMSEIEMQSSTSHKSHSLSSLSSYWALSARHMRYLKRLQKIDRALNHTKSHSLVSGYNACNEQSCNVNKIKRVSSLACGSLQMLYKQKDNPTHRLSLPLNLQDLGDRGHRCAPKVIPKRNKGGDKVNPHFHYNLRGWRNHDKTQRMLENLPLASAPKPKELSPEELALLQEKEELTLMELRIFLRDVLNKLGTDKKFSIFAKPVNIEDAADYYDIIEHPMDLSSMMAKIDLHEYGTVRDFLNDIDLICSNALEYNPDRGPMDRIIRHRACALKDTAYAIIKTELDKEFEKTCAEIQESRKRRGEKSGTVPNFYNTKLKYGNSSRGQSSTPAVSGSLDEKQQPPRSIPKPDGERFSRRVRGMQSDPVPPLESVEKVYKASHSTTLAAPAEESCPSATQKSECLDKNEQKGDDVNEKTEDVGNSSVCEKQSSELVETDSSKKEKVGSKSVPLTSPTSNSNSKKKRSACVWCKPKRKKRRRFTISKQDSKSNNDADNAEKSTDESSEEGDEVVEEESVKDEDMVVEENMKSRLESTVSQQLVVDTADDAGKSSEDQREEKVSCSRTTPTSRVSTRRSSLSPRYSTIPVQPASEGRGCESQKDQKPEFSDKDVPKNSTVKELLQIQSDVNKASGSQLGSSANTVLSNDKREKGRVVKRLDLDLLITDSGHGSSLESNGDSRDSVDHNKTESGANCAMQSTLPALQALVNQNHNCSQEMRNTAEAILAAPNQTMTTDIPRMTLLLNKLVKNTEDYNVERLEKIYSQLSQLVYRNRHNPDKTLLLEALESKVKDMTQTVDSTTN